MKRSSTAADRYIGDDGADAGADDDDVVAVNCCYSG